MPTGDWVMVIKLVIKKIVRFAHTYLSRDVSSQCQHLLGAAIMKVFCKRGFSHSNPYMKT